MVGHTRAPEPTSTQDDSIAFSAKPGPAAGHRQRRKHLCRAVRQDNMSRLNLEGAVHIRDADFIIEEMDTPEILNNDATNIPQSSGTNLYAFAWSLCAKFITTLTISPSSGNVFSGKNSKL